MIDYIPVYYSSSDRHNLNCIDSGFYFNGCKVKVFIPNH